MRDTMLTMNKSQKSGRQQSLFRFLALTLCIAYIAVSLLGAAYLLTHIEHEHDHDGPNGSCVTCSHIIVVGELLKQLSSAASGMVLILGGLFTVRSFFHAVSVSVNPNTLVKLKVRLNN